MERLARVTSEETRDQHPRVTAVWLSTCRACVPDSKEPCHLVVVIVCVQATVTSYVVAAVLSVA